MNNIPVIAVFDAGKTNKKLLLFDAQFNVVLEEIFHIAEIKDEDGFPCENLAALEDWILNTFNRMIRDDKFNLVAVNFSAYGASFIYLDKNGQPLTPLYNYLKPYPTQVQLDFYAKYGGEEQFSLQTASPVLGSLNSGLQLYRLKQEQPDTFRNIQYALHLPQYLSYVLSGVPATDMTSIGCHTHLWNFADYHYHRWVYEESIAEKFPAIRSSKKIVAYKNEVAIGVGIHDSSAALVPYLLAFKEKFVLVSTGTWCIALNPFNREPLTADELRQDCLCYLSHEGTPVKASRLFAGHAHEHQVKRLARHFNVPEEYYKNVKYDHQWMHHSDVSADAGLYAFESRELSDYQSYEHAYHQLMVDMMRSQQRSIKLVMPNAAGQRLIVDGGFSTNEIYMQLLANAFPETEVMAAEIAQATALGAAILMADEMIDIESIRRQYTMKKYQSDISQKVY